MKKKVTIKFKQIGKEIKVEKGTTLLEAAILSNVFINSVCGGEGTCGKCKVIVKGNYKAINSKFIDKEEINKGYTLACQTLVENDLEVIIPEETKLFEHKILKKSQEIDIKDIKPHLKRLNLKLPKPTLNDNLSDLERLKKELMKYKISNLNIPLDFLKTLPDFLRENNWKISLTLAENNGINDIVKIDKYENKKRLLGLAIDIGTTTVVVNLVNLENGHIIGSEAEYNKQIICGEDVLSRINYTEDNKNGLDVLKNLITQTLNFLISELMKKCNETKLDICFTSIAGNTTMMQLFFGLIPHYLRIEPYIPTANLLGNIKAKELGIDINPESFVYFLPSRGSYVGGDITADILASDMYKSDKLTLLIDVGTNGEVVLGNKDWLVACSCSAGPAFEGGEVEFGMRAMKGAIEKISLKNNFDVEYKVIGNVKPKGICGSGLIDLLAELFQHGLIDRTGRFKDIDTWRVRLSEEKKEFVIIKSSESSIKKDIVITEIDIQNIIRTKGSIYAACSLLIETMGYSFEDIKELVIAGGFGNYIDTQKAILLGLLPDLPLSRFKYIGNGSLGGAYLVLLSKDKKEEAEEIFRKMTYIELSVNNKFFDEYSSALFLPHTELEKFPCVEKLLNGEIEHIKHCRDDSSKDEVIT